MYKVLLVDDEYIDLEGMRTLIPWKDLGMEVVSAVTSATEALRIMGTMPIDLLVTDIQMPSMTGLELIERSVELQPRMKAIIISGYDNFQYAKKAISVKAAGYILKPVDDQEIIATLSEVKQKLDSEAKEDDVIRESLPYLRSELLKQWLDGTVGFDKVWQILHQYGMNVKQQSLTIGLTEVDDVEWKLNHFDDNERRAILDSVHSFISDYMQEHGLGMHCRMEAGRTALIMVKYNESMRLSLKSCIGRIADVFPVSVTIGIGSTVTQPDEVHSAYLNAQAALRSKMFQGKGKVISLHEVKSRSLQSSDSLESILDNIFNAMANYDLVGIDDCLQRLFGIAKQLDKSITVYNFFLHIISRLNQYMQKLNEDLYELLGWNFQHLDILYRFETMDDIESWLRRRFFELSELLHNKKARKNWKLIEEVCRYMENHIDGNLSLRMVAEAFGFTPNYLGYLFKEEIGESFSDYMISKRLEMACTLLTDPKLKIYEIADRIGYKNLTHFSKIFKDRFGVSPIDYRKRR
ncbi:MAG: response regulator [Gorillibacterium sp.]|nr:response regulator [Gorillibacterium sp.]